MTTYTLFVSGHSEFKHILPYILKSNPHWFLPISFNTCCISNALDGSEDDILWEDDGEDKDDNDWVTDSDSVMSDDGESEE